MPKLVSLNEVDAILDSVYPSQINLKSFDKKQDLNRKIWGSDNKLKKVIRKHLVAIANDFMDDFDMGIKIDDIVFVGSLAGYNWSKYSDVDLHIMVDFSKLSEYGNPETLKKLFDMKKNDWNKQHDVLIYGYPVEIYVQEKNEENASNGIYSVKYDKWIKIPSSDDYELNKELIKTQASQYINIIDKIEELTGRLLTKRQCKILRDEVVKLNDEIIQGRRDAIAEAGEYAPGNIVFKVLRRSGHIGKLKEIKSYLFDKINTI